MSQKPIWPIGLSILLFILKPYILLIPMIKPNLTKATIRKISSRLASKSSLINSISSRANITRAVKSNIKIFSTLKLAHKFKVIKFHLLNFVLLFWSFFKSIFSVFMSNKDAKFLFIPLLFAFKSLFIYKWFRLLILALVGIQYLSVTYDLDIFSDLWLFILSSVEYQKVFTFFEKCYLTIKEAILGKPKSSWNIFGFNEPAKSSFIDLYIFKKENVYVDSRPWYIKKRYIIPIVIVFGGSAYLWGAPVIAFAKAHSWIYAPATWVAKPFTWMFGFIPNPFANFSNPFSRLLNWFKPEPVIDPTNLPDISNEPDYSGIEIKDRPDMENPDYTPADYRAPVANASIITSTDPSSSSRPWRMKTSTDVATSVMSGQGIPKSPVAALSPDQVDALKQAASKAGSLLGTMFNSAKNALVNTVTSTPQEAGTSTVVFDAPQSDQAVNSQPETTQPVNSQPEFEEVQLEAPGNTITNVPVTDPIEVSEREESYGEEESDYEDNEGGISRLKRRESLIEKFLNNPSPPHSYPPSQAGDKTDSKVSIFSLPERSDPNSYPPKARKTSELFGGRFSQHADNKNISDVKI